MPLAYHGELRHVVILGWNERREISDDDVATAELAAASAAAGLRPPGGGQRHAARSVQDSAVMRAASALNASLDLQEILLTLVHEAALALEADISGAYLGNAHEARSRPPATACRALARRARPGRRGRVGPRARTGKPFICNDYARDVAARSPDARCLSALAVPMEWGGELRGVLSIGWNSRRRVHEDDLRTLEAIAGLATAALRNAEAYEHVQHVARTDALTGVLNHGAMQIRIREEIARARRDEAPLGAVILDLDDFKRVNDTRGHAAGDELLQQVAQALQGELRPYDQVARYGGDEFVLLLPGSDEETTAHVAERCRDAIGGAVLDRRRLLARRPRRRRAARAGRPRADARQAHRQGPRGRG